jgi:Leucine-rich repeat (LRR) protein
MHATIFQVTTLHLDGQGISKLSNLEKLTSLRWASFSENNISKIEVKISHHKIA